MSVNKVILWLSLLLFGLLLSCTPNREQAILPTVAQLPTNTPLPTHTILPTVTPYPTFTLAPQISTIDLELTKVFGDLSLRDEIIDRFQKVFQSEGFPPMTPSPEQLESDLESRAYIKVVFGIIDQEMPIRGAENKSLGGTANSESVWFKYEYISSSTNLNIEQNIPELLCSFKEAGLVNQYIKFTVEQNRSEKNPYQGSVFCFSPKVMQSLNCAAPDQMNLKAIEFAPDCPNNIN